MLNLTILYETNSLLAGFVAFMIGIVLAWKDKSVFQVSIACCFVILIMEYGSLTLAHSQNSQMSFMYGFFFVKFLFFTVVCVVIVI